MTAITIALSDELMQKLNELAIHHNVSPEDLIRASVQELLASPEDVFSEAVNHVLNKNQELYKRLAA